MEVANISLKPKDRIGKGSFSTAYLQMDGKTVVLQSCDPVKECMALGYFPASRLFPKVEMIGCGLYKMKHYPRVKSLVKSLRTSDYLIYKQLRNIACNLSYPRNSYEYGQYLVSVFEKIRNKRLRDALIEAVYACMNYDSSVCFEISPRNVSVSPTGRLILLDCFYLDSKLKETRGARQW